MQIVELVVVEIFHVLPLSSEYRVGSERPRYMGGRRCL